DPLWSPFSRGTKIEQPVPKSLPGILKPTSLQLAETLLLPRIAVHVVPTILPVSSLIVFQELNSRHPFGALPRIQSRHNQTQRPTMLHRDWLTIMSIREKRVHRQKSFQRH